MKLIGGFNVRHLFEQVHQLREIEKLGEAGARPVAGDVYKRQVIPLVTLFCSLLTVNFWGLTAVNGKT